MSSKSKVLAVGVFDILHYGHLCHLTEARRHGNELIVGVTQDAYVKKGPDRPVFDVFRRMAMLRAFAIVDRVISVEGSLDALRIIRPHILALGKEYEGKVNPDDAKFCRDEGIQIVFTNGPVFSSTDLLHFYANARQR